MNTTCNKTDTCFRLWQRCGEGCSSGSANPQECECPPGQGADDHPYDNVPGGGSISRGGSLPNPLNLPSTANLAGGRASMSSQVTIRQIFECL